MATPLDAPMPANLDLGPGFTLRVTALAVADGSVMSGITVSNFSVLVGGAAGVDLGVLATGPFMLVPGPNA